uniref:RanBD1 domain-containing protein n=1 Tax=Aureoumbra lagunensis TaxID=44058 RepID=A0A7S3K510_9STRA|mmetsp:Transcript_8701/g.13398  ORF Transcript_8701/g.13398 Transcript_8701/m.13398 type:complete len:373 (-) Transcript_8701:167-1285(-)
MNSGAKRRNENGQLRKEEYEDQENEVVEAGSFKRASASEIAKRRIVSVSSRFQKSATKDTEKAATPAVKENPFTTINLTSRTTAANMFAPAPTSAPTISAQVNAAFKEWIQKQEKRAPCSNWSVGIKEYLKHVTVPEIKPEPVNRDKKKKIAENKSNSEIKLTQQVEPLSVEPQPTSMFFSKALPTSNEKKPLFDGTTDSISAQNPPKNSGLFSPFISSASSLKIPAFSFGSNPMQTQSGEQNAQEDEDMPKEAPSQVLRADDGDENELFESRAGIRRLDLATRSWKDLGKGTARLMQHKSTQAKRMIVRNDVGKVVLNFKIDPKMIFTQKKRGLAFQAITDPKLGLQTYLLLTKDQLTPDLLQPASFKSSL